MNHHLFPSSSSSSAPAAPAAENRENSKIPVEIISEEEMSFIEAALASTCSMLSSSLVCSSRFSFVSVSQTPVRRCKKSMECCSFQSRRVSSDGSQILDIEDSGVSTSKSFLQLFRSKRSLSVSDITDTEWCEKQMEFTLLRGKPKKTEAMIAGSNRHIELEEEVLKRVDVHIKSPEDSWAVKFMNFITGADQFLSSGLTRELPILGFVEGVWMVGIIDEIRMSRGTSRNPYLVDTKTRSTATLPSEAQKRKARLQLMCYKFLWDSILSGNFSTENFFNHFDLDPEYIFSHDVKQHISQSGLLAETLQEMVTYYIHVFSSLPVAHNQLLLRYEFQEDHSLLGEFQFDYDSDWVKNQIQHCLKFWLGEREADYVSKDEQWKCRYCSFADVCPKTTTHDP